MYRRTLSSEWQHSQKCEMKLIMTKKLKGMTIQNYIPLNWCSRNICNRINVQLIENSSKYNENSCNFHQENLLSGKIRVCWLYRGKRECFNGVCWIGQRLSALVKCFSKTLNIPQFWQIKSVIIQKINFDNRQFDCNLLDYGPWYGTDVSAPLVT